MFSCFWKCNVGICEFSSIETKSCHTTTRVQVTPAARGLEEIFSAVLERFLEPIHDLCVLQELGWKYMYTISNFVRIFLLNPNFLLAHRNMYSEGTDNAQKTPHGHPDFNSYVQNLRVFIFQTDRHTNRQTDREINPVWAG
jgi:hypothetical protein